MADGNLSIKKIGAVTSQLANTGAFLRENKHLSEAIKCFEALSFGDETYENGDYAYEIALCYLEMGDAFNAKNYFRIAINANPAIYSYKVKELKMDLD